jgi:hypothetical protein
MAVLGLAAVIGIRHYHIAVKKREYVREKMSDARGFSRGPS